MKWDDNARTTNFWNIKMIMCFFFLFARVTGFGIRRMIFVCTCCLNMLLVVNYSLIYGMRANSTTQQVSRVLSGFEFWLNISVAQKNLMASNTLHVLIITALSDMYTSRIGWYYKYIRILKGPIIAVCTGEKYYVNFYWTKLTIEILVNAVRSNERIFKFN